MSEPIVEKDKDGNVVPPSAPTPPAPTPTPPAPAPAAPIPPAAPSAPVAPAQTEAQKQAALEAAREVLKAAGLDPAVLGSMSSINATVKKLEFNEKIRSTVPHLTADTDKLFELATKHPTLSLDQIIAMNVGEQMIAAGKGGGSPLPNHRPVSVPFGGGGGSQPNASQLITMPDKEFDEKHKADLEAAALEELRALGHGA